jgi:hypothetical protein
LPSESNRKIFSGRAVMKVPRHYSRLVMEGSSLDISTMTKSLLAHTVDDVSLAIAIESAQPPRLPQLVYQILRYKPSGDGTVVPIGHTSVPPPRVCVKQSNRWPINHRLYHGYKHCQDYHFVFVFFQGDHTLSRKKLSAKTSQNT